MSININPPTSLAFSMNRKIIATYFKYAAAGEVVKMIKYLHEHMIEEGVRDKRLMRI